MICMEDLTHDELDMLKDLLKFKISVCEGDAGKHYEIILCKLG